MSFGRIYRAFVLPLFVCSRLSAVVALPPPPRDVLPPAPPAAPAAVGAAPVAAMPVAPLPAEPAAPAEPVEAVHLNAEDILPEDVCAFISSEAPARIWREIKNLRIAGLFEEPMLGRQLEQFFTPLLNAFEPGRADPGSITGILGAAGLKPASIANVFQGRLALAVRFGGKDANYYFIADLGQDRERFQEIMEEVAAQIEARRQEIIARATLYRGMDLRTYELPGGAAYGYTSIHNLLVFGAGKDAIAEIIDLRLDAARKTLAETQTFQELRSRLGDTAYAFYYLNLPVVLQGLGRSGRLGLALRLAMQPEWTVDMLTGNVGTLAGAAYPLEGGVRDRIVVSATNPAKPLLPPGAGKEVSLKTLTFAPLDSLVYSASYLDASQVYREAVANSTGTTPEAAKQLRTALHSIESPLSLTFEQLLAPFKGEAALIVTKSVGRPYPDAVLVLEAHNMAAARDLVEGVKVRLKPAPKITHVGRLQIASYEPAEKTLLATLGLAPAFVMVDEFLVLGTSAHAVRKVVQQRRFATSSITQSPGYMAATRDLPQHVAGMCYLDLPRLVEVVYDTAVMVSASLGRSPAAAPGGLGPTEAGWPLPELVAAHLLPVAITARAGEGRLYLDIFSPVGVLAIPAASIGSISEWAAGQVSVKVQKEVSENLQVIGAALHMYAADFDRFPLALSELFSPNYISRLNVFMAPTGKHQVFTKEDIDGEGDFVYVPGVRLTDLADSILVYTRSYVHGGNGRSVLFLAPVELVTAEKQHEVTSVAYMTEDEFRAKMAEQGRKVED